jgi:hypothetical protein
MTLKQEEVSRHPETQQLEIGIWESALLNTEVWRLPAVLKTQVTLRLTLAPAQKKTSFIITKKLRPF